MQGSLVGDNEIGVCSLAQIMLQWRIHTGSTVLTVSPTLVSYMVCPPAHDHSFMLDPLRLALQGFN